MPIKSKYYASILRLVRVEDVQNPDNLLDTDDPFYKIFEVGSYKSMMGMRIKEAWEARMFCEEMSKRNNATYIYQIRELEEDDE